MNVRTLFSILFALPLLGSAAPEGPLDQAKAYLKEVKQVLLTNYIDGDKLKAATLEAAAAEAMAAAPDLRGFAALPAATRDAVKKAIAAAPKTPDAALDAANGAAPDLDLVALADHGARAMVKSLGDRFSRLQTPEDMKKMRKEMEGQSAPSESLGLVVDMVDGRCVVIYLRYGFAADAEGVEMGDEVVSVDGRSVAGKTAEQVMAWLKVPSMKKVEIGLKKPGMAAPAILPLVQREHRAAEVESAMLGDGVGYLRMTMFGKPLKRETKKALAELKKQGMERLVLDLRHNPGGIMKAAGDVADFFLGQGLVITTVDTRYHPSVVDEDGDGIVERSMKTSVKSAFEDLPMTVLIDGASASSSELLAGALQDHHRATLVGTKSYGKGIGQTTIPLKALSDGKTPARFLYLTVLRYLLPSGRSIHHTGLTPDVEVAAARIPADRFAERCRIRGAGTVEAHVDALWKQDRAGFEALVKAGTAATAAIPGLESLTTATKGSLSGDELRDEVARVVRNRLIDEDSSRFFVLPERDPQLKAGMDALVKDPSPVY